MKVNISVYYYFMLYSNKLINNNHIKYKQINQFIHIQNLLLLLNRDLKND